MKHNHNIEFCKGKHSKQIIHNEQYDAYFCPRCKEWTEPMCDDSDCEFCFDRPEKAPGMARVKYNDGQGAILCSSCSIIIKEGNEFTDLENEFLRGIITYLPEYFCEECKILKVENKA